jgi:Uma2 family endonuclease
MAANPERKYYSLQQYMTMLRNSERRLEYDRGDIYAMAGGSANHVRLSQNMWRALDDALSESPTCVAYMVDRVVAVAEDVRFQPDVVVSCDPADHEDTFVLKAPRLVVEVLSHSTEARDRTYKLTRYQSNEHVQEVIFISQYVQHIEVISRTNTGWDYQDYGCGQEFTLTNLDITILVADVYRRLSIPAVLHEVKMDND